MKKILFPILGALILFFSCKKSDSGSSASIVGTWNINKVVSLEYVDGVKDGGDTTTTGSILLPVTELIPKSITHLLEVALTTTMLPQKN